MIKKFADHFNPSNMKQVESAHPAFTPASCKTMVKKFHPASTTPNTEFIQGSKVESDSGVPKTKWWAKMEKAQLN